jgi:hypothetical protein
MLMDEMEPQRGDPPVVHQVDREPGRRRPVSARQGEVYEDWQRRTQEKIKTLVWAQPSIRHSHFKDAYGEIHTLSPWRLVDYWTWTTAPRLEDFLFTATR